MVHRSLPILTAALIGLVAVAGFGPSNSMLAVSYAAGWNLVSGPQRSTLVGAAGSIYTLQPGDTEYESYPATTPLKAGWGYWAYFPTGGALQAGPAGDTYRVTLSAGEWAMVGDPSDLVDAAISGADRVLSYDPVQGHQPATSIAAGHGAWMLAQGTVSLLAIAPAAAVAATPQPAAAPAPQPAVSRDDAALSSVVASVPTPVGVGDASAITVDPRAGPTAPIAVSIYLSTAQCLIWSSVPAGETQHYARRVLEALTSVYLSVPTIYETIYCGALVDIAAKFERGQYWIRSGGDWVPLS